MLSTALCTAVTGTPASAQPAVMPPAVAAAAAPAAAQAATPLPYRLTGTPLLLVHGYSDDCDTAFDETDRVIPGPSAVKTIDYFRSHGFPTVKTVGYYRTTGSQTSPYSDGSTHTINDDSCDADVQNESPGFNNCGTTSYIYTADPIEHLSCLMAWYLYEQPQPVDIIAHSMGGLVVRGAMYFSTHHPADGYTWPSGALPVSRVITVATPHDGLQAAVAVLYNAVQGDQEVRDMTVCPNYQPQCTLYTLLDTPYTSITLQTSAFMTAIRNSGEPKGSVDTYWALMGSSEICSALSPRSLGSCLANKAANLDPYTTTDYVVQADSQMAMPADAKVFYGDIQHVDASGAVANYFSGSDDYNHEANTCLSPLRKISPIAPPGPCATGPFYLNDGRTGTTKAWMCTSGCTGGVAGAGIANLPYTGGGSSASTVPYALGEMAHLLLDPTRSQIGHAAHVGNDYPYGGMGLFGRDEGVDGSVEFYGQCDSFAAWKVYENLGGTERPAARPAKGWQPDDIRSISPVLGYADVPSKAGTWGDAHDWIRSDQGLHAAPYFGVPFDSLPQPGSIAVWATHDEDPVHGMGGDFGHVAYVTDVIDANTIQIENVNMHGNGLWSTDLVTRSGGGADTGYGGTVTFTWPTAFVHLGDGPVGPAAPLVPSGNSYPAGTYGPTSASGGPSFTLAGSAFPNSVDGWSVSRPHGVIGWELYTSTHTGAADSIATWNPTLPTANTCYEVDAFVPDSWSNSAYAMFTVTDQHFGTSVVPVDENIFTRQYAPLGVFQADAARHLQVQLTDQGPGPPGAIHQVAADGMRYIPDADCSSGLHRTALVMDAGTPGFTTTDVWYAEANHGLRGNERWTHTNGTTTLSTATYTPKLPVGCYQVDAFVPDYGSNASAALYTITDGAFTTPTTADIDESPVTNVFVTLGVFETRADGTIAVKVVDQNPLGFFIAADAMKFTPASCNSVGRWSVLIDPAAGSPDFTTAGPTAGLGDVHGWYHSTAGGFRGNQWWTYAGHPTPVSTATYSPSGLPRAGGCFDMRVFVPDNHANNPQAGYLLAVQSPTTGFGLAMAINQSTPTNAWVDLGTYAIPPNGYITITVTDTSPTNLGQLYTSADAIDFRASTGC
jgi:hypothetical protein